MTAAVIGPACAAGSPVSPSSDANASAALAAGAAPSAMSSSTFADLELCAEQTNQYRATIGLNPLLRSAMLEDFAAYAAAHDGVAHLAHDHFSATNGAGIASAETEILWWRGFTVRGVIQRGLAQ